MILAVNTSSEQIEIRLIKLNSGETVEVENQIWPADRTLSDILLPNILGLLGCQQLNLSNLNGLIMYKGPGGYTALRIAASILNTLADQMRIPIIGVSGSNWLEDGLIKLKAGGNDKIVLPVYARGARITQPIK